MLDEADEAVDRTDATVIIGANLSDVEGPLSPEPIELSAMVHNADSGAPERRGKELDDKAGGSDDS